MPVISSPAFVLSHKIGGHLTVNGVGITLLVIGGRRWLGNWDLTDVCEQGNDTGGKGDGEALPRSTAQGQANPLP